MSVSGTSFPADAIVQWNRSARSTTFVSSTQLQASINATDIATVGSNLVSISSASSGGAIATSTFFTGSTGGDGFAEIVVNQQSNDLVSDPVHQVIYLSVPSDAGANGNTISVLDPATGTVTSSQFAGSEPDHIAISDDSQFLYAGLDGSASVQRFILPTLSPDISYSLGADSFYGPYFALDLQVAPGAPHTTAVTLGNTGVSPMAEGGIVIFDDAIARPTTAPGFNRGLSLFDSLQWGSDATALFAANDEDTNFDFYTLSVNSTGVTLDTDYENRFSAFPNHIHFDRGTGLIYSDDGHILDPSNGAPVGVFAASGVMVPDSTLNSAFFVFAGGTPGTFTVESFDMTHFTPINSLNLSNASGSPTRLIRWGNNGVAFNTSGGQVYLIGGNFVH